MVASSEVLVMPLLLAVSSDNCSPLVPKPMGTSTLTQMSSPVLTSRLTEFLAHLSPTSSTRIILTCPWKQNRHMVISSPTSEVMHDREWAGAIHLFLLPLSLNFYEQYRVIVIECLKWTPVLPYHTLCDAPYVLRSRILQSKTRTVTPDVNSSEFTYTCRYIAIWSTRWYSSDRALVHWSKLHYHTVERHRTQLTFVC